MEPQVSPTRRHPWIPRVLRGPIAVLWLIVVAVAFLAPTLVHGTVFAPFDLLNAFGLGHHSTALVHNNVDSDLIQQDVPWLRLEWTQFHHGHLPLWNPYSGEGMPLGLDFITATFSLPTLLTLAFPVQYGLLVSVLAKIVIAGTGAYLFARVLGFRRLSSVLTGTVFELCGAFTVWLGWSQTGVMAWAGWVFAAVTLVVRGRHRVRSVILLAVVYACSVLGGHPESSIILTLAAAVYALVLVAAGALRTHSWRSLLTPAVDLGLGLLAGLGLSAPLWLPGIQLSAATARFDQVGFGPLPARDLLDFLLQGYDGLPLAGAGYVGAGNYYDVTAFVGVIAVAFAVLALVTRWRRPEVAGLGAVLVLLVAVVYVPPVNWLITQVPHGAGVNWNRALMPASLAVAALAGAGLDRFLAGGTTRSVQRTLGTIFALLAVGLAAVGLAVATSSNHLPPAIAALRDRSFVWPTVGTVAGLVTVAVLWVRRRRTDRRSTGRASQRSAARDAGVVRGAAVGLVLVETAFLVLTGSPLWTTGQAYFASTSGESALQRAVGTATVGFGSCPGLDDYADLGILPEANVGYGVHELAFYDTAVAPSTYYTSWARATGTAPDPNVDGVFCPAVTTVALARRYGVAYLLEPPGQAGPPGSVPEGTVGDEGLFFVPGAAPATLGPVAPSPPAGGPDGTGTPVTVTHPDDATWRMAVHAPAESTLYLRVTDVPGWRATVDGRPVPVRRWDSVMVQVTVPAGDHDVVLTYWPQRLTLGLAIAGVTAAALVIAAVTGWFLARRRRRPTGSPAAVGAGSPAGGP